MARSLTFLVGACALVGLAVPTRADPPPVAPPGPPPSQVPGPLVAPAPYPACCDCQPGPRGNPAEDAREDGGHATVEAGVYLLHPFFAGNAALIYSNTGTGSTTSGSTTTTATSSLASRTDLDYGGLNVAPWVGLGYTWDNGVLVRARWWQFQDNSTTTTMTNSDPSGNTLIESATPQDYLVRSPGPVLTRGVGTDVLTARGSLRLDVLDAEVGRTWHWQQWSLECTGGGRFAHLAEEYQATRSNNGVTSLGQALTDSAEVVDRHHFNGGGPTAGLGARWHLGESGLTLYGQGRASLLFGSNEQDVTLNTSFSSSGPGASTLQTLNRTVTVSRGDFLPILELELGAEYRIELEHSCLFFRSGVVGQTWFNAGNASSLATNLGLLGLSATAGLSF